MIALNLSALGVGQRDVEKICPVDNKSATDTIRLQADRVLSVTKTLWFGNGWLK